jgi:hypothetical protein
MTQDSKLDPFDLERLVLSRNFAETAGVKKLLTIVPVRKPNAQDFVRTHPSPAYRRDFLLLDLKDEREQYLVRPEMANETSARSPEQTGRSADQAAAIIKSPHQKESLRNFFSPLRGLLTWFRYC